MIFSTVAAETTKSSAAVATTPSWVVTAMISCMPGLEMMFGCRVAAEGTEILYGGLGADQFVFDSVEELYVRAHVHTRFCPAAMAILSISP